ncbi:MAG: hypothetical protein OXC72_04495, partial [Roseovarius sp.]|nr:hypothetical protein [Roseovarius sp.]MCY4291004.1 hypothetical protein [Roseovarius sp.]
RLLSNSRYRSSRILWNRSDAECEFIKFSKTNIFAPAFAHWLFDGFAKQVEISPYFIFPPKTGNVKNQIGINQFAAPLRHLVKKGRFDQIQKTGAKS